MLNDSLEKESTSIKDKDGKKIHPWRICSIGEHYVKLISSFDPETENPTTNGTGIARGLMQLTDATLSMISGQKPELKENFVSLTPDEATDPTANICAGVRWLFMKYAGAKERITKSKLDRQATWDDAVAEYKGILKGIIENKHPDPKREMPIVRKYYQQLSE